MAERSGSLPAEREAWAEQGFFFRAAAFAPAELARLGAAAEDVVRRAEAAVRAGGERYAIDGNTYVEVELAGVPATVQLEHAPGSRTVRVIEPCHALHPEFERLIDDARVVAPMRALVGAPEVALFTDKLNLKRPREGSRFQWHQDSPYWAHFCAHLDQLPNVMVTLDDADASNGCFRLIRGEPPARHAAGAAGRGGARPALHASRPLRRAHRRGRRRAGREPRLLQPAQRARLAAEPIGARRAARSCSPTSPRASACSRRIASGTVDAATDDEAGRCRMRAASPWLGGSAHPA